MMIRDLENGGQACRVVSCPAFPAIGSARGGASMGDVKGFGACWRRASKRYGKVARQLGRAQKGWRFRRWMGWQSAVSPPPFECPPFLGWKQRSYLRHPYGGMESRGRRYG